MPKFRAWDKKVKEMIEDVASIHFKAEMITTSNLYFYPFKDIELMKSTGLKDKNGKEIYEGDIIYCRDLWLDGDRRKTHKQIVKYDSGMFSAGYVSLRTNNSTSEIIGNIYENPELLQ